VTAFDHFQRFSLVVPGGRNFCQKAHKRPGKKIKSAGRICGRFFLKVAEKGPKIKFPLEVPSLTVLTYFR
jgi:hypothetical protein